MMDLDEIKTRINPLYAGCPGTESHERKWLCDRIDGLTAERDALAAKLTELEGQEPVAFIKKSELDGITGDTFLAYVRGVSDDFRQFPLYARPNPAEHVGYNLPAGSMGAKKLAQLGGGEHWLPMGLVLHNNVESVAITEHGRVTWGDSPAHRQEDEPVNARLLEALKACRDQFQHYVQHHLDKGNLDKAAQNERFVALADAAIASVEAPKNGD